MRQHEENFYSMAKAVLDVLSIHTAVWTSHVAFSQQVELFNDCMQELDLAVERAQIVTTGATSQKNNAKIEATTLVVNLAKRACVYALNIGNMELHDQFRVSNSTFLRRSDTLALAKMREIHTRLSSILPELGDYGVTVADLDQLKTLIDTYDELLAQPRLLIVKRKGYNQSIIPELFSAIRVTLRKMDGLINLYEGQPFRQEYVNARIIVDLGHRKKKRDKDA